MVTLPLGEVLANAATAARVCFEISHNALEVAVDDCKLTIGASTPTAIGVRFNGNTIADDFEFETDFDIHEYVKNVLVDLNPFMIKLMYSDHNMNEVPFIDLDQVQVAAKYQFNKTPVANAWTRESLKDDPTLNHDSGEELNPTIVEVDVDSEGEIGIKGSMTMRKMGITENDSIESVTGEISSATGTLLNKPEQDTV